MPCYDKCDICQGYFHGKKIDGKTMIGPWADMCVDCFPEYGIGIGTGLGQAYVWDDANSKWQKVAG